MTQLTVSKRSLETVPADERGEFANEKRVAPELIANASTDCTSCGSAGCHTSGCPMENGIPEINRLYQDGVKFAENGETDKADIAFQAAFDESWKTNRWGLLTGRLCPSDKLCEGSCIYKGTQQGPILIRGIEYDTHARAWESGWVPALEQKEQLGKSIAIVGSGFGAIAAAEMAFEKGYDVTVYDRAPVAGGLGAIGIPRLKMDFEDPKRYTDRLEQAGVEFVMDTSIGDVANDNTVAFSQLAEQHDAIIVATGKYKPKSTISADKGGDHTVQAIDFLSRQSLNGIGIPHEYDDLTLDAKGKRVVVIGGGDTAMDCLRTAKTIQNAQSSTLVYYKDQSKMAAGGKEVQAATEEGAGFEFNASTDRIVQRDDGVKEVHLEGGKVLEADMVIQAVGFDPENLPGMFGDDQLPVDEKSGGLKVKADKQVIIPGTDPFDAEAGVPMAGLVTEYKTAAGKVVPIAGVGDIVVNGIGQGPSLAVHALAGGRDIVRLLHDELLHLDKVA